MTLAHVFLHTFHIIALSRATISTFIHLQLTPGILDLSYHY
jgi:hypothetical protein